MKKLTNYFALMLMVAICLPMMVTACSDDDPWTPTPTPVPTTNSAGCITDQAKLDMIYSLVDLEGNKGRLYEMTYTVDYKLDEALDFGIDGTGTLTKFVVSKLFDQYPPASKSMKLSYDAGCSAFAAPDSKTGNYLMGRNFDFNHFAPGTKDRVMIPAIVVHTAPKGGKKSVSLVDGKFVDYNQGFYNDTQSDLSMLMALPYLLLDGINEDGFAVSVLKLDGLPTRQDSIGKKTIFTTVAMRMCLDHASTVKEAVAMLNKYNMHMDKEKASYHFFMADATGDYAIVEYTDADTSNYPTNMEVLTGNDTLRCVTNFYVSPTMAGTKHGIVISEHGKKRYENLRAGLLGYNYRVTPTQAKDLLKIVAQGPNDSQASTGFTQWSEVFNLSKKTFSVSILREWDKTFEFGIEQNK